LRARISMRWPGSVGGHSDRQFGLSSSGEHACRVPDGNEVQGRDADYPICALVYSHISVSRSRAYSAIRRRTEMAAWLRSAINAGRPYATNNRRSGRCRRGGAVDPLTPIIGLSEVMTCCRSTRLAALWRACIRGLSRLRRMCAQNDLIAHVAAGDRTLVCSMVGSSSPSARAGRDGALRRCWRRAGRFRGLFVPSPFPSLGAIAPGPGRGFRAVLFSLTR
jgi:hypothetical protein